MDSKAVKSALKDIHGMQAVTSKGKQNWMGLFKYYTYFHSDYLNKKYDNVCASKLSIIYTDLNELIITPSFSSGYPLSGTPSMKKFIDFVKNCKKRFVVIPVNISSTFHHQNMLIYDKKSNEIELYDPLGDETKKAFRKQGLMHNYNSYIASIENLFVLNFPGIKFYTPVSFTKGYNIQDLELKTCDSTLFDVNSRVGFCVAWTMWYSEMRIRHPDIHRIDLLDGLYNYFKKGADSVNKKKQYMPKQVINVLLKDLPLCNVVRDYTKFLFSLSNSVSFKEKALTFIDARSDLIVSLASVPLIVLLVMLSQYVINTKFFNDKQGNSKPNAKYL